MALSALGSLAFATLAPQRRVVQANGVSVSATVVRVPLSQYEVRVATAGSRVHSNASLLSIATAAKAECAINGTFLAAYAGETGEPYGTVVVEGRALHLGSSGTRLDVGFDGRMRFVREDLRIRGAVGSSSWYAYNLNVTPRTSNYSYVFTPDFGPRLTFAPDAAVVVRGGVVTRVTRREAVFVPADGFVIALDGVEVAQLAHRFSVGASVTYRVVDAANGELNVRFGVGAGPLLVSGGRVVANPAAEGFRDAKVLTARTARSAVGLTASGELLLVTMANASIAQTASVLRSLGAIDAMNLDGGASSGLVCGGRVVTPSGRALANAIVVKAKP